MASQPRAKDYDHLVKLLLIGDSGKNENREKRGSEDYPKKNSFLFQMLDLNRLQSKTSPHLFSKKKGVGKSCLLLRFSDDSFTSSYITTIG